MRAELDFFFSFKTQVSMKYILINIKMRTIVSILIRKSRVNIVLIVGSFVFMSIMNFMFS